MKSFTIPGFPRIPASKATRLIDPDRLAMYQLCRQKAQERLWRNGSVLYEYDQNRHATICEDFGYEDWAECVYRDFIDQRTAQLMELQGVRGVILVYEYPESKSEI